MQRFVDHVLGVTKESIKAFSQESFNNTVKLINGFSALILAILPGKAAILEGVQGWELRPTFRAPRLPRWMEEGVSSFNEFIHQYADDSDADTEYESDSGIEDYDSAAPPSPSSHTSQLSKSSSFRFERRDSLSFSFGSFLSGISYYFKYLFHIGRADPSLVRRSLKRSGSARDSPRRSSSTRSLSRVYGLASKGFNSVKDYVVNHSTDRRRGVIEDLQLVVELFIERVFDVVRKVLMHSLSPVQTLKLLTWKLHSHGEEADAVTVETATLGVSDPAPLAHKSKLPQAMNTDARTCEDVITDLGYPYEAIRVVTDDGYILLLERIPRRESQKVLYLQHGLLDSSLGWVSNGVVGSQAFAAHDQGYDVFLGNFRGLASREHIDKKTSSQRYWSYSVNEHGTQDIPAMINKIHAIKMEELKSLQVITSEVSDSNSRQPYTICGVAHSLGGAALLMYVVTRRLEGKAHRLSRLILLSPAGFHEEAPFLCGLVQYIFPAMAPLLAPIMPGLYIPTKTFRGIFNKLARDFQNYPALGGLVQTLCSYTVGGDSSNWVEALGQTHYNMYDMPGVAYRVVVHLAQMRRSNRFQMYDFGSVSANMEAYGTPHPLDIGANYAVIDIPVDVVAGRKDKLIPRAMVRRHYQMLKDQGCKVSYEEFEYAHLDFTFAHREELLAYIISRLLLVTHPELSGRKSRRPNFDQIKAEAKTDSKRLKILRSGKSFEKKNKMVTNDVSMIGTSDTQQPAGLSTSEAKMDSACSVGNGNPESNFKEAFSDQSVFGLSSKNIFSDATKSPGFASSEITHSDNWEEND